MADTKISALTDGTTAAATDRLPVARSPFGSGDNRYVTPAYIKDYIIGLANTWSSAQTFSAGTVVASGQTRAWSTDLFLHRDAANVLAQRNGTSAQKLSVYNTFTDASNYERGFIDWAASANVLSIGTEAAGTGTARNLRFTTGGTNRLDYGVTNASSWTFSPSVVFSNDITLGSGSQATWTSRGNLRWLADGNLRLQDSAGTSFGLLQFGGTSSSFPALKRSTTVLQARLADDSDFAPLQGKLRTQANAVAETPTATHTMIITDAGGTAYRVLCVV